MKRVETLPVNHDIPRSDHPCCVPFAIQCTYETGPSINECVHVLFYVPRIIYKLAQIQSCQSGVWLLAECAQSGVWLSCLDAFEKCRGRARRWGRMHSKLFASLLPVEKRNDLAKSYKRDGYRRARVCTILIIFCRIWYLMSWWKLQVTANNGWMCAQKCAEISLFCITNWEQWRKQIGSTKGDDQSDDWV